MSTVYSSHKKWDFLKKFSIVLTWEYKVIYKGTETTHQPRSFGYDITLH